MEKNNRDTVEGAKKSGILAFLTEDRGGTNFKQIFAKIPERYYEYMGFAIMTMMFLIAIVEEAGNILIAKSYHTMLFYLVGGLAEIFAVIYILSRFFGEERLSFRGIVKTHIWDIALLCMLLWACISTYLAEDRHTAIYGYWIRHDGLLAYFIYGAVYVCGRTVKSEKLRVYMARIMGVTISLMSVMTLFQANQTFTLRLGRIGINILAGDTYASVFLNTNHFAYVLTIGLLALAGLVIYEKKLAAKLVWLILFGFNTWALILNDTFGCYIAVIAGMIFLAVISIVSDRERYRSIIAVFTIFIAVSVGVNVYNDNISANVNFAKNDVQNMSDNAGSGRIGLWKHAIECIGKKPLFGYGPEGLVEEYADNGYLNDRPHNEYIQHAAFLGIPGLMFYLVALISLFIAMIKNIKRYDMSMLLVFGVIFAYCLSAFFGNTMYYTAFYFFAFLGMGAVNCTMKDKGSDNIENKQQ